MKKLISAATVGLAALAVACSPAAETVPAPAIAEPAA